MNASGPLSAPQVLRVESMPLACGGTAVVVELDGVPSRAWMKSLKRALLLADGLDGAQAKFDGRFVYVVGVEVTQRRAEHRVMQVLSAAEGRPAAAARTYTMPPAAPSSVLQA
ncbi:MULTISPECIES: hypothetical protein [Stenotrophomonas]|uniref:hypothetical protein n=1 Tax=Stenotrophomonas TaxID=40323 RepID=UPI001EF78B5A|nr:MULTISPECIES: hypothetical protein [Stenotrophomonas]MDH2021281.1 hypothetical protein [Stenotrophomonas sp. GD03680]